jgi:hypothetical protein
MVCLTGLEIMELLEARETAGFCRKFCSRGQARGSDPAGVTVGQGGGHLLIKHGQDVLYLSGELSRLTGTSPQAVTCHGP